MSWIEPVFDRTLADVQHANENRGSPLPLKGARNYTDLIRITGNIKYVIDILTEFGHKLPAQKSKLDWEIGEIPRAMEIDKIRQDMEAIRAIAYIFPETPRVPALPYTFYEKMNDIEKILFDVDLLSKSRAEAFVYSGEMYSGEEFFNGYST